METSPCSLTRTTPLLEHESEARGLNEGINLVIETYRRVSNSLEERPKWGWSGGRRNVEGTRIFVSKGSGILKTKVHIH